MANELQITGASKPPVLCLPVFSCYELGSLVDRPYPGVEDRIIDLAERAELAGLVAKFEVALVPAPRSKIEEAVAMLSLAYPALKVTPQEAAARIELYAQALADLPQDVLQSACMEALKECKFFPSVSEIRERCGGLSLMRWRLTRMKHLIAKHDAEYRAPEAEAPMSAADRAEMERLKRKFGIGQANTEEKAA